MLICLQMLFIVLCIEFLVNVNFVTWIFLFVLINEVYVQHSCACSRELKVITETCMLLFYYRILLDKCLIAIKCICLFLQNDVQCYNPTILLDVVWVILHISSLVLFFGNLVPFGSQAPGIFFREICLPLGSYQHRALLVGSLVQHL